MGRKGHEDHTGHHKHERHMGCYLLWIWLGSCLASLLLPCSRAVHSCWKSGSFSVSLYSVFSDIEWPRPRRKQLIPFLTRPAMMLFTATLLYPDTRMCCFGCVTLSAPAVGAPLSSMAISAGSFLALAASYTGVSKGVRASHTIPQGSFT